MEQMKAGAIREFSMEKRYRCKDSSLVWVALSVSPLWPPGAAPTKHVAVVQDITSLITSAPCPSIDAAQPLRANKNSRSVSATGIQRRISASMCPFAIRLFAANRFGNPINYFPNRPNT